MSIHKTTTGIYPMLTAQGIRDERVSFSADAS